MFHLIRVLQVTKIGLFKLTKKPGFTIEVGLGLNPLPISQFEQIYNDILGILILGSILA